MYLFLSLRLSLYLSQILFFEIVLYIHTHPHIIFQIGMYIWLYFTACEVGYHGSGCDKRCPYPSYGLNCALKCNCIHKDCHYQNGCNNSKGGILMLNINCIEYSFCIYMMDGTVYIFPNNDIIIIHLYICYNNDTF